MTAAIPPRGSRPRWARGASRPTLDGEGAREFVADDILGWAWLCVLVSRLEAR